VKNIIDVLMVFLETAKHKVKINYFIW